MKYHRGWVGQAAGNLIRFEMSTGASTRNQFGLLSLPGLQHMSLEILDQPGFDWQLLMGRPSALFSTEIR